MKLFITHDSFWEAKVDIVLDTLYRTGYKRVFEEHDYGSSLNRVAVVLVCQDPDLNLKQRIRFSKKEKTIYLDILLDLPLFLKINQDEREKIIVKELISEIPKTIEKYRLEDFDLLNFTADLKKWVTKIL